MHQYFISVSGSCHELEVFHSPASKHSGHGFKFSPRQFQYNYISLSSTVCFRCIALPFPSTVLIIPLYYLGLYMTLYIVHFVGILH